MKCTFTNFPKNRRAVSQIMGSLMALGIVTSIGSVLLFNGMSQINAFNYDVSFHDRTKNEAYRENLIFEHIRFEPLTKQIILYLTNTGTTESAIGSITIVQLDTQKILVNWEDVNSTIQIKDSSDPIILTANITSSNWQTHLSLYPDAEYEISITTSKGNFFSTVARPFNT
jgi:hypothetical protein